MTDDYPDAYPTHPHQRLSDAALWLCGAAIAIIGPMIWWGKLGHHKLRRFIRKAAR